SRLPLTWTKAEVILSGIRGGAATHVPAMIFPSAFAPDRYVVLNSGHTFGAKEFQGTNALLYPRLGDYALLRISREIGKEPEVVTAGLFDEMWRFPAK